MKLRLLPYVLGAFSLVPLLIWSGLWLTTMSGPNFGFENAIGNALFAVSIPIVIWFTLASMGQIANSIAGVSSLEAPDWGPAGWILRALPATTLMIGVGAAAYLAATYGLSLTVAVPLALAVVFAVAIRKGEQRRVEDAGIERPERWRDVARPSLRIVATGLRGAIYMIPVLGWLCQDAIEGHPDARLYFALNLSALWLVALWFAGLSVIIWTALLATPLVFIGLMIVMSTR